MIGSIDLDTNNHQTLHCDACKDWLRLEHRPFGEIIDEIRIKIDLFPILICPTCNTKYYPYFSKIYLMGIVRIAKEKNKTLFKGKIPNVPKYDICSKFDFKYDPLDCKTIPGLSGGLSKEGFFTPVFFNRKVLDKYLNFDGYRVDIAGNTYGTIHFLNGEDISYGINRNNKMFCWLGDIEKNVPENECHYLLSENISSDHDIASEFYAGQIECKFANYSNEHYLLNQKNKFEQHWNKIYNTSIFKPDETLYELLEELKAPVNWNKKSILSIINSLNGICIEYLNQDSIILALNTDESKLKNKKSLKLLENLIDNNNPKLDASKIMNPFFVLYDFRIILDHRHSKNNEEQKIEFCYKRLNIPVNYDNFEIFYNTLLKEITQSYSKLLEMEPLS